MAAAMSIEAALKDNLWRTLWRYARAIARFHWRGMERV